MFTSFVGSLEIAYFTVMVNKKSVTVSDGDNSVVVVDTGEMEVDNDHQQDDVNVETTENNSEQVTEELTQTDHLNKKLLQAFLTRINTSNEGQPVSTDSPDDSPEWVDKTT